MRLLVVYLGLLICPVGCGEGRKREDRSTGPKQARRARPAVSETRWSPRWPSGFKVERTVRLEAADVARLARAVGANYRAVANYHLRDQTTRKPMQVNVVEAASVADARRFLEAASRHPGTRNNLVRHGRLVVECRNCTSLERYRLQQGLGLPDRGLRRYRFKARVGLLEPGAAAGEVNKLYGALLQEKTGSASNRNLIRLMLAGMKFGSTLWLRLAPTAEGRAWYDFDPKPRERKELGVRVAFRFQTRHVHHGIPWVTMTAEVATRGFTPIAQQTRPGAALTAATARWPTGAPQIQALAKRLINGRSTARQKLEAVHSWAEKKIRYGGHVAGSRDGILRVLERGFGRCWDKSDLLVTLARAAGLPARQVGGWLFGSWGHIWAEVWIKGKWIPVDATAPWLGVGGEYIPLWISEDGEMPIMYLNKPEISIISQE